jgi:alpha-glucosidase
VLSRSGYAGLQRYGALWTGDNVANWEHLKLNISMVLNLGLSGMPLTGADIGGFSGAPTPELFVRWMQLGALIPLFRGHTEKGTPDQEPWAFGDEVEEISRTYLELRYTMIHHLYDLAYEASQNGVPIVRPLFMEFPQDQTTYPIEDAYMVGDDLLVAPVVEKGAVSRMVYLPQGAQWLDYWTGKAYEGGQSYDVDTPLDVMPLFVKAGSIIPTQEAVQYVGEKEVNPITFLVYPGADDEYTLYLDDENTKAYQEGQYREVKLIHQSQEKQQTITFDVLVDGFTPTATGDYVYLKLLNVSTPVSVKIAGQNVSLTEQCDGLPASTENVSCFDAEQQMIQVKLFGIEDETVVEVQY